MHFATFSCGHVEKGIRWNENVMEENNVEYLKVEKFEEKTENFKVTLITDCLLRHEDYLEKSLIALMTEATSTSETSVNFY
jgi:hypothetical protein